MKYKSTIAALFTVSVTLPAFAANYAYDNASAHAYDDGWQNGDNGGYGWGAWTLSGSGTHGHFIGTSTQNGNGSDDGTVGGVASDSDINTTLGPDPDQSGDPDPNSTSARAWGMYANNGSVANAYRSFTGGALSVGQTVAIDFDNGYLDNSYSVGVGLLNASGNTLWEVFFTGGQSNYRYQDGSGFNNTTISYGDEGVALDFTLTSSSGYQMTLTRLDGTTQTITGSLISNADQAISQVRLFNAGAGSGTSKDAFFNSISIVPEPSAALLGSLGALALLRRRRA